MCSVFAMSSAVAPISIAGSWSREETYLFQERHRCVDLLSIGGIQLLDVDAVEITECAVQSIAGCVSGVHVWASTSSGHRETPPFQFNPCASGDAIAELTSFRYQLVSSSAYSEKWFRNVRSAAPIWISS
jgi:hypothetical protein